eukprot:TRINITY_DN5519_c0_g1_i1.p1 TRINITY_DN5519_c0_g1~~TRINITY_DN5519_c0_g1_i1.p1  ORF type:complete len:157 (-),score=25.51 TRINITY_DN5519_c0_g1_i1:106-576(-)
MNLSFIIEFMKPLVLAIQFLEGDFIISNVLNKWMELESVYRVKKNETLSQKTIKLREFVGDQLNKKWDLISDHIHAGSFLLDPRFREISLPPPEFKDGEVYKRACRKSSMEGFGTTVSRIPRIPWAITCRDLADVAIDILTFPQSSAACEWTMNAI